MVATAFQALTTWECGGGISVDIGFNYDRGYSWVKASLGDKEYFEKYEGEDLTRAHADRRCEVYRPIRLALTGTEEWKPHPEARQTA